jgi:hypothetical protein
LLTWPAFGMPAVSWSFVSVSVGALADVSCALPSLGAALPVGDVAVGVLLSVGVLLPVGVLGVPVEVSLA